MADQVKFIPRDIKEYECSLGPKLILIADKPLEHDRKEIFDSVKGMSYLNRVFQSKFKSAETHVTYVNDTRGTAFARYTFFNILEYYAQKGTIDFSKLVVAFVGQSAFEAFDADYYKSTNLAVRSLFFDKDNKGFSVFDTKITGKVDLKFPYVILPEVDDNYTDIAQILNNTNIAVNIKTSPYCDTKQFIRKLETICLLYDMNAIKGFRYNMKLNPTTRLTEYCKVYDSYTDVELIYCSEDDCCKNDDDELKLERKNILKKIFTTVPVYSEDLDTIINTFKFRDSTGKIIPIQTITEDEANHIDRDRKSWAFYGDEKHPNGESSEWYSKWYHNAYIPYIRSNLSEKQIKRENYNSGVRYEWIYDIEVFKYDWLFVAMTLDRKNRVVCWNDGDTLRKWIKNKILIGFNNSGYDDAVIKHAMIYPYTVQGTPTVKEFSDALIYDQNPNKFPELAAKWTIVRTQDGINYNEKGEIIEDVTPPNFLSWDISLHGPFDIRRNSLKKLTMSVLNRKNYDSAVPFDIQTPLTQEQREEVERYCTMDVDNTLSLYLPEPGDLEKKAENPKYKMREFARDSYDIKWNLIVEYKMQAKQLITKSASFAAKVLCGENAKPNLKNTYKVVNGQKQYYAIPELAYKELAGTDVLDFYIKNQQNPDYIKEKFETHLGGDDEGHLYQFGFGGLHQALIKYGSTNLVNMDVASLYPSLLIQYNLMSRGAAAHPDSYEQVYHTRIEAKHTGNTLLNLGLKLVLNSAIGAMLSKFNPLYDTWSNSTICVHGQLLLFILVKRLFNAGFNIIQTNTDGIMIERQADVDFMPISENWVKETRLVLEYDEIDLLQQNNVNNYYCKFSNGKVKSKGFYLSNEKYGKATSTILCNLVTHRPLLENTLPRDYVIYKRHGLGEICDAKTKTKLEGRSLAFIVGYPDDPETEEFISISRNPKEVVVKDEKGKPVLDENGNEVTETIHSESKINGFTQHMKLIDDLDSLTWEEINTQEYINFAKNLLDAEEIFGPYYDEGYNKSEEPAFLQSLNPLKDHISPYPTNSGVVCQNFLFECDYLSKEEQEDLIEPVKDKLYRVVWSGHRSYHCVVRIDKPVPSNKYKNIWYYLQHKLGFVGADAQVSTPGRYTRTPDVINPKTGEMQTLYCEPKYVFSLDEILEDMPRLKEQIAEPKKFSGKSVTREALIKQIKKLDWGDGSRFVSCQKLSPVLMSTVSFEELILLIPTRLDRNQLYVLKGKYYYFKKHADELIEQDEFEGKDLS